MDNQPENSQNSFQVKLSAFLDKNAANPVHISLSSMSIVLDQWNQLMEAYFDRSDKIFLKSRESIPIADRKMANQRLGVIVSFPKPRAPVVEKLVRTPVEVYWILTISGNTQFGVFWLGRSMLEKVTQVCIVPR
jgi:hypothetical protein